MNYYAEKVIIRQLLYLLLDLLCSLGLISQHQLLAKRLANSLISVVNTELNNW